MSIGKNNSEISLLTKKGCTKKMMMNKKRVFAITAIVGSLFFASGALAQAAGPKAINTGGPAGAYHGTFCPPLPPVLANAYFQGYSCTTSAGTLQNISRVLSQPTSIGFAQFDVFAREANARPAEFSKLAVIRSDIAYEGLFMVTKNPDLDFGRLLGLSRRIQFVLPAKESGSAASFNFLRAIDPDGLGRVPDSNITYVKDATTVLSQVANSTRGEVGFFVQFADPRNANIKMIIEKDLRVIPVISREILRASVGDQPVYQAYSFTLSEGGMFGIGGKKVVVTTSATPVAIFTGSPDAFSDRNGKDDAKDMIERIRQVNRDELLPKDSFMASLVKGATRLSQTAVDQAIASVEQARKAVEGK